MGKLNLQQCIQNTATLFHLPFSSHRTLVQLLKNSFLCRLKTLMVFLDLLLHGHAKIPPFTQMSPSCLKEQLSGLPFLCLVEISMLFKLPLHYEANTQREDSIDFATIQRIQIISTIAAFH